MIEVPVRRAGVGRADLLRAIASHEPERLALEHDAWVWFGFVRKAHAEPVPVQPSPIDPLDLRSPPVLPAPESPFRLPLQMQSALSVVERIERQRPPTEEASEAATPPPALEPLTEADLRAIADTPQGELEDLIPFARLMPALRRYLGGTRMGALDVDRLSAQIANGQFPRQLPRRRHARWHPSLVVVLDFSARLWPYRRDQHRLARQLLRHCGSENVSIRIVERPEAASWFDWCAEQGLKRGNRSGTELSWQNPPPGTPVLIVGDLGLLLGAGSAAYANWHQFVQRIHAVQSPALLLTPLGTAQIDSVTTQLLPILGWGPEGQARPIRGHGSATQDLAGLEDLLALVSATRRVDPRLLRAFRKLLPSAARHPGLEGALWCHPDMVAALDVQPTPEARRSLLARFSGMPIGVQSRQAELREQHHRHLQTIVNDEESLVWSAATDQDALADPAVLAAVDAARTRVRRLAAAINPTASTTIDERLTTLAAAIESRAEPELWARHADLLTDLVAARVQRELATGAAPRIPAQVDPGELAARINGNSQPTQHVAHVVIDMPSGQVQIQSERARQGSQSHICRIRLDAAGARFRLDGDASQYRWFSPPQFPLPIAAIGFDGALRIESAVETVVIDRVRRPRGVAEWRRSESGLVVISPDLCGKRAIWLGAHLYAVEDRSVGLGGANYHFQSMDYGSEPLQYTIESHGLRFGFGLDSFGTYAEFEITSRHGSATQRLRWIEPGAFLMGSPNDEPERDYLEGPQHEVTISEGFWLADTPCTHALWRAVMGEVPSFERDQGISNRIKNGEISRVLEAQLSSSHPSQPVSVVDWYDVQRFLRQLESALFGTRAILPSEAEWEYACRAGTNTPFSFDDQITPARVNYNGDLKGKFRIRALPVKSLPANAWGLYDMHGNIWEWCADGRRRYGGQPQRDPFGSRNLKSPRALRGGSFISNGSSVRSASRRAAEPGSADRFTGFRLSLRSIQSGPAVPGGSAALPPTVSKAPRKASSKKPPPKKK